MRRTILILAGLVGLAGCNAQLPEPKFAYREGTTDIHAVPYGDVKSPRNPVEAALLENFGTPNNLVVWEALPIDYGHADPTSMEPGRQTEGWKIKEGRNLYMVHCLHCHGVAGDGNGPTAKFLDPIPRDYRNGVFKFTSTDGGIRPSRHDLRHIVKQGIPGTSMPAFVLLGDEQVDLLVEYVRFLAMRGEYERRLVQAISEFASSKAVAEARKEKSLQEVETEIAARLKDEEEDLFQLPAEDIADNWTRSDLPDVIVQPRQATVLADARLYSEVEPRLQASESEVPTGRVKLGPQKGEYWLVRTADDQDIGYIHQSKLEARTGIDEHGQPTAESLARGRELYLSEDVFCYKCHGLSGRGDGPNTEIHWPIPNTTPELQYEEVGLHDDWGHVIHPRNLTRPVYRGGRRPIDFYRRLRVGIKGTPMPGYSTAKYKGAEITDDDLWAIVNYVMHMPFEGEPATGAKSEHKVASFNRDPQGSAEASHREP